MRPRRLTIKPTFTNPILRPLKPTPRIITTTPSLPAPNRRRAIIPHFHQVQLALIHIHNRDPGQRRPVDARTVVECLVGTEFHAGDTEDPADDAIGGVRD